MPGWGGSFTAPLTFALELTPAAGPVVRDDLLEHGAEGARVGRLALPDGHRTRGLVVVPARDDPFGIGDDPAVVEENVDVVLAASRAQMLPSSTKYGWTVRLMVSTTSGSAAWTNSRTSRQIACCHWGRASM